MKILVVAENIFDKSCYGEKRPVTGLAVMVRDIFDEVSKYHDCYVLATNMECRSLSYGRLIIVENDFRNKYRSLSLTMVISTLKLLLQCNIKKARVDLRNSLHKKMVLDKFNSLYQSVSPDIVNLHDLSDLNTCIATMCIKRKIKVIVTSHLYIGKSPVQYGYSYLKNNEDLLFSKPSDKLTVSFVSTGMKNRFVNDYPSFPKSHIFCVVNGTKLKPNKDKKVSMPNEFKMSLGRKVLLCIGTYCQRKNQDQIIRAFEHISETQKKQLCIMFIGKDDNGELKNKIKMSKNRDCFIYCGKIPQSEMYRYYYYSDGTITTSLNESFGLTIIEGFSYGKPAVFFKGLDSYSDLYDPFSCMSIDDNNDEAVANTIIRFVNKDWDSNYIKKTLSKFSMERVSNQYIEIFQKVLQSDSNC